MVRQAWLMTVVGVLLMGCAFLPVVGCSGETGTQPAGSQKSEDSQPAVTGSERTVSRDSESTHNTAEHTRSQASEESESPDKAPEHGGSINAIHKATNYPTSLLLKVDGVTYYTSAGELTQNILDDDNLGSLFAEVNGQSASSTTKDRAASKLVPVYAVEGYDTSFRLAARVDGRLALFEVFSNPEADEGSDVLNIGGEVSIIAITNRLGPEGGAYHVGSIQDPEKVDRAVQALMSVPVKPTGPDYFGTKDPNTYGIEFGLKDGTWVIRHYSMDTGRLSRVPLSGIEAPATGIVAPRAFREAIEEGVDKRYQRLIALEKAKSRSCSDTRTSQEVRRIDSSGGPVDANEVAYTTNDGYPSGPWGGVLRGTTEHDELVGEGGEDKVHGLGGDDTVKGGACDDKLYGGPGRDHISGDGRPSESDSETSPGKDILYGGDGNDTLIPGKDGQRDEVYCGKGKDVVEVGSDADEFDYVGGSCEKKEAQFPGVAGLVE